MMAPPKMSELKLCVSQGGFLCVLVLCAFPGYVWKLYVMLPEPLFHNLSLTNPATVMRKKNTLKNPVIQYF